MSAMRTPGGLAPQNGVTSRRDGNRQTIKKGKGMIEWFIFIASVVLPLVVGRCIAFGMGGGYE